MRLFLNLISFIFVISFSPMAEGAANVLCLDDEDPGFYLEYSRPDQYSMKLRGLKIAHRVFLEDKKTEPCEYFATPYLPFYFVCEVNEDTKVAVSQGFVAVYENNERSLMKSVFDCRESE